MAEALKKKRRKKVQEEEEFGIVDWEDEEEEEEVVPKPRKKRRVVEDEYEQEDFDPEEEEEEYEEEDEEEEEQPRKSKKNTSSKKSTKSPVSPTVKQAVKKLNLIKEEMATQLFERKQVLNDIMLCLVAGENILLLGPPGTGKSLVYNVLSKHIVKAQKFAWLMNRTTDPADIVGPYSVKAMENDRFLRITTGKFPEANIAFLDEIFKANEPVLNYLLSALNEGVIYNDGKAVPVDLRITIGASNEYPESEDLDAFYDRFVFRHWVNYINDGNVRKKMAQASLNNKNYKPTTTITLDEIDALQEAVELVQMPSNVANNYEKMIRALSLEGITISDRRYVKGQQIMRANALLHGRLVTSTEDFKALTYMMWNKDIREIQIVEDQLGKFVNPYESKIKDFVRKAAEVKTKVLAIENRSEKAGEAVQANVSLQDILDKIDQEIVSAKGEGIDIAPLEKMYDEVEEMMAEVSRECLKQTTRGTRRW